MSATPHAQRIYLDFNATTPLAESVLEVIHRTLASAWGNPSSSHNAGIAAKSSITEGREQIARMVGGSPSDMLIMSGGTEANNLVVSTAVKHFRKQAKGTAGKPHVISTTLEHDSVGCPLRQLQLAGEIDVTFVSADPSTGAVRAESIDAAITERTCLVSVMLANNETGIIQPVRTIADTCKAARECGRAPYLLIHTDAAQAIGKIPVSGPSLGVDYLTIVGHKFYGPRIGALYVRGLGSESGAPIHPIFFGGGQERNFRPGTENTGMIAGLGEAARLVSEGVEAHGTHMRQIRDFLEAELSAAFGDKVAFNGKYEGSERLPNTCNFSILTEKLIRGRELLSRCTGLCASVGAACHSDQGDQPSPVLIASGVSPEAAARAMRWSVGRETSEEQIKAAVQELREAVKDLSF